MDLFVLVGYRSASTECVRRNSSESSSWNLPWNWDESLVLFRFSLQKTSLLLIRLRLILPVSHLDKSSRHGHLLRNETPEVSSRKRYRGTTSNGHPLVQSELRGSHLGSRRCSQNRWIRSWIWRGPKLNRQRSSLRSGTM